MATRTCSMWARFSRHTKYNFLGEDTASPQNQEHKNIAPHLIGEAMFFMFIRIFDRDRVFGSSSVVERFRCLIHKIKLFPYALVCIVPQAPRQPNA